MGPPNDGRADQRQRNSPQWEAGVVLDWLPDLADEVLLGSLALDAAYQEARQEPGPANRPPGEARPATGGPSPNLAVASPLSGPRNAAAAPGLEIPGPRVRPSETALPRAEAMYRGGVPAGSGGAGG